MADQSDQEIKPWTIKGIPPEIRNAAIAAADREDKTIGEWIGRAILQTIKADRQADRAPVPVEQPRVGPSDAGLDLDRIERLAAVAERMAAAAQKPVPPGIRAQVNKLVKVGLRALEGPTG